MTRPHAAATPEWHAEITEQMGLKQRDLLFAMIRNEFHDKSERQNSEKRGRQ